MKQWTITINGKQNTVIFKPNQWSGKHILTINGKEIPLKNAPFQSFIGIDQPINIAGKECRFVLIGNKADIAIDGIYVDNKKTYAPLKRMPWWAWLFIAICVAVPIVSLGGAVPVLIAALGSMWCIRLSVSPNIKTSLKVLSCFGVSALAWALYGLLVFAVSNI